MATEVLYKIASAGAGGDQISLSLLEDALDGAVLGNLQSADNRVFAGTLTGTISNGNNLSLYRGGSPVVPSTVCVCQRAKSGELVVYSMNTAAEGETYGAGDVWWKDASNYFTISNAGDSIIPILEGYNTAGSGADGEDTTATTISGWTTYAANYIEIRGAASDKTSSNTGKWSTERYRLLSANASALVINEEYVRVVDFQAGKSSSSAHYQMCVDISTIGASHDIRISGCVLKQAGNALYAEPCIRVNDADAVNIYIWNCIGYGAGALNNTGNALLLMNAGSANCYSCTWIGNTYGVRVVSGNTLTTKNTYASGSVAAWSNAGTLTDTNCGASDTSISGTGAVTNVPVNDTHFKTTASQDYHLAGTGSSLYNVGTDTSGDAAPLNFTTDIDGDTRSTWDIGADEYVAAGGTEYPLSVSGAVTPTGSLSRQAGKILAGGISPSGTLARSIAKPFSASITPAGSIAKSTGKNLSGALTPTGALSVIKTILLALAGAITPAGSLIRQTAKGLSGSVASAGTVIKSTAKSMAGSITPSGALSVIKTFLLSLSGAITPAGALMKSTGKALAGSIAGSGTMVKSIARSLAGGITPSGALTIGRIYQLALSGILALSGVVTKAIGKALAGSLSLSGSVGKSIGKALAGVLGLVGSVIVALTGERRFDLTTTVSKSYVLTSSAREAYVLRTSIAKPYMLTVSVSTRG